MQAREAAIEKYRKKNGGKPLPNPVYAAMVESFDIALGRIRAKLEQLKIDRLSDFLFDMRTKETWDHESNEAVAGVVKELGRRSASLGLLAKKESDIQSQIHKIPSSGPRRAEALLALRESLADSEFIIRPELANSLARMVLLDLGKQSTDWKELAHLCEIGGFTRHPELVEPVRSVFLRASGLGLKSAARQSLLHLGLTEAELNRKPPVQSILLLEPSAFFRKRLVSALAAAGRWQIREAGGRGEAGSLLEASPVDLVISEAQDGEGDLVTWLEQQWNQGRCRAVFFSTASRDVGSLAEASWVEGTLFKPYPMEQLLRAIEN